MIVAVVAVATWHGLRGAQIALDPMRLTDRASKGVHTAFQFAKMQLVWG